MSVAPKIVSDRSKKTRTLIIDNATKIFAKQGFRNISVEELCKALSISKGTFYKYFPNKEALVETVFEESVAEVFPAIEENFNSDNDIEQILEIHYSLIMDRLMTKVSARMLADIEILMPRLFTRVEKLQRYEISQLIKLLKRGQNQCLIKKGLDPEVVSILLEEVVTLFDRPDFYISRNISPKQVASTIKTIFLYGVLEQNKKRSG